MTYISKEKIYLRLWHRIRGWIFRWHFSTNHHVGWTRPAMIGEKLSNQISPREVCEKWGWGQSALVLGGTIGLIIMMISFPFLTQKIGTAYASAYTTPVSGTTATIDNTGEKIYFDSGTYHSNVTIDNYSRQMSGFAWSEDLGWIDFGLDTNNVLGPVEADASGHLSGEAKALNGGYIDFNLSPTGANVAIAAGGDFSGYAWSDDLGWIDFTGVAAPGFMPDLLPPGNPSDVTAKSTSTGVSLTPGNWYSYATPYFSWSAPPDYADSITPSGIAGYYVYFGTSAIGNPSSYQTATNYTAAALGTNYGTYYLRIKTKDNAGNIAASATVYTYLYDQDDMAPPAPTLATAKSQASGGTDITSGNWYNDINPYFTWNASVDVTDGDHSHVVSGTAGYYVYFGPNASANPVTTSGLINAGGAVSYTTDLMATVSVTPTTGTTNYLLVKAKDNAGNTTTTAGNLFTYKYDGTGPTAPLYVSVNPSGYTRTNTFTFTWPVEGLGVASDASSGLAKYQYRIGSAGDYQDVPGDATTASITLNDIALSGVNTFYLRAVDMAGNTSAIPAQTSFYFNETSPTAVQALTATPTTSATNSFAFSWNLPLISNEIAGYYYSVNALPTLANASYTTNSYLDTGHYATQQGVNTLYVVAKDTAGNYDLGGCTAIAGNPTTDTCAKVDFTTNTAAPGMPTSVDAVDGSNRDLKLYKVFISWEAPIDQGAGFAGYEVYRSTTGDSFVSIGTTSGTTYADTGLESRQYYYYIESKDNAGQHSAPSSIVTILPTGRYTEAPVLTVDPQSTTKSFSANIYWETDRESSSFVYLSTSKSDIAQAKAVGDPTKLTKHSVDATGLNPSTIYYYQVMWEDTDGNQGKSGTFSFVTKARPKISNVEATNITLTSATISWESVNIVNAQIDYCLGSVCASISRTSAPDETKHLFQLTNLSNTSVYTYKIIATDIDNNQIISDSYNFNTLTMPKFDGNVAVVQQKDAPTTTYRFTWDTNVPTSTEIYYVINGGTKQASTTTELTKNHDMTIHDLADKSAYSFTVTGTDSYGNSLETPFTTQITTPGDTRAPKISNLNIELKSVGFGATQKAQIVVSWNTDEPGTSQVEYAQGISGSDYNFQSQEDPVYATSHVVIVTGLNPSQIYHFRAVSSDASGNKGFSEDTTVITGVVQHSVFDIILGSLEQSLGWLSKISLKGLGVFILYLLLTLLASGIIVYLLGRVWNKIIRRN